MRDKKDNATIDLPGFEPAGQLQAVVEPKRAAPRSRRHGIKQVQLELIEETDNSGLPVWRRDDGFDLTGLPVWAPDSPNPG